MGAFKRLVEKVEVDHAPGLTYKQLFLTVRQIQLIMYRDVAG